MEIVESFDDIFGFEGCFESVGLANIVVFFKKSAELGTSKMVGGHTEVAEGFIQFTDEKDGGTSIVFDPEDGDGAVWGRGILGEVFFVEVFDAEFGVCEVSFDGLSCHGEERVGAVFVALEQVGGSAGGASQAKFVVSRMESGTGKYREPEKANHMEIAWMVVVEFANPRQGLLESFGRIAWQSEDERTGDGADSLEPRELFGERFGGKRGFSRERSGGGGQAFRADDDLVGRDLGQQVDLLQGEPFGF